MSDSETYLSSSSYGSDWEDIEEDSDEMGEAGWLIEPYEDGLTPAELEARFEQEVAVDRR